MFKKYLCNNLTYFIFEQDLNGTIKARFVNGDDFCTKQREAKNVEGKARPRIKADIYL